MIFEIFEAVPQQVGLPRPFEIQNTISYKSVNFVANTFSF